LTAARVGIYVTLTPGPESQAPAEAAGGGGVVHPTHNIPDLTAFSLIRLTPKEHEVVLDLAAFPNEERRVRITMYIMFV
jgi:hypothetical protein